MAASGSQKSDFFQIVMLTFFLCAVFFTGWGIFSNLKVGRLLAERRKEEANLKNLAKTLKDQKSIQTLKDFRAREASKENTGQIDTAVDAVLRSSSLTPDKRTPRPPRPSGAGANRIYEHEYKVTFNPAPIDDVLTFIARLEVEQPHLEFRAIKVTSKKRKEEDPDVWELDITLVTYTTET